MVFGKTTYYLNAGVNLSEFDLTLSFFPILGVYEQ